MATIAVIAAGAMGSAVGRRLVQGGCTVLTNLDGRSEATRKRAAECGMEEKSLSEIANRASYVLSILPPSSAFSFAEKFLQELKTAKRITNAEPLVFVDCNAVSPATVKRISTLFSQSSSAIGFIDSGIIGGPPQEAYNPTFYASADDKHILLKFGKLSNFGLKISLLEEGAGIGDASALKMSYAGMTKGTTALFTTMILAAHASSPATAEALLHELGDSQPEFLRRITRTIPPMLPKAYRWVGEMEEIGSFVGGGEGAIYEGIAKLYQRVEQSLSSDQKDVEVLKKFVEEAKKEMKDR
ncbi:6-phosphogluconate dehydrogenase C-terminal domain-like protein [Lentinula aff. lateritia]|uniref:6-phosphogluconate dehydrogenase C-terminal domain-like protein n=1 Tax=Lentinula aff. lateritia TaxID=2804960 RepID=A0ACC1U1J3_9AGAR|nr:6-phosphogluconate dehydrogenase C-terminal domain-like protein [Lentinula aff. lateritia]